VLLEQAMDRALVHVQGVLPHAWAALAGARMVGRINRLVVSAASVRICSKSYAMGSRQVRRIRRRHRHAGVSDPRLKTLPLQERQLKLRMRAFLHEATVEPMRHRSIASAVNRQSEPTRNAGSWPFFGNR
jgi:hypothetical protein